MTSQGQDHTSFSSGCPALRRPRILFITSNRLGDAILSTGVLDHLHREYPDARITVACGSLATGIFESAPGVDNVIALRKRPWSRHWLDLWLRCFNTKWAVIVDLRNSAVSRLLWSNKRYIWGGQDATRHKVEQNAQVLGLKNPPPPRLWPSDAAMARARQLVPPGLFTIAIGPAANWKGKTWPAENFISLIARLRSEVFKDCRIAVFAAPGEEDEARRVLASVPPGFGLDIIARTDPATAAAALSLCQFYIGNDSGLMHCAAAVGIPTLGLFGPSRPEHYRPWGAKAAYVATPQTMDELIAFKCYDPKTTGSLMGGLTVDAVYDAAVTLKKVCTT